MSRSFQLARIPPVRFGAGKLAELPEVAAALGHRALLVTGASSLKDSGRLDQVRDSLKKAGLFVHAISLDAEPSTLYIDSTCDALRNQGLDLVIGIGGGSVIDAAKAISAMLPHRNSVLDHLEDVGTGGPHSGIKLPYIAVPTTSGTGGEMTKNAVISKVGSEGYKKSLRHDNLIPDAVIVDPELMLSCPSAVTAACGMDAFTQLLESYLSTAANPVTDALAWSGLERLCANLIPACGEGAGDVDVRADMAYAAMLSGIVLANAGLGVVHGVASPLGGFFPIPHGVVCGTLVASATEANIRALRAQGNPDDGQAGNRQWKPEGYTSPTLPPLEKYARVGRLFDDRPGRDHAYYCDRLVEGLREWTEMLRLPRLGTFGVLPSDLARIADKSNNRNNPIALSHDEICGLLASRL